MSIFLIEKMMMKTRLLSVSVHAPLRVANRPFQGCFEPHYEGNASCKAFHLKISFVCLTHACGMSIKLNHFELLKMV